MTDDRSIRVRLLADIASYRQGMAQAATATKAFGSEVSGSGKTVKADVEKVGRAALLMSGGMTLALGAAAKAAMNWESAWAGVTKTVSGSPAQMAALEDSLRSLSTRLPATHEEIAGVAEAAGQLGIQRTAIADFTETMIALGVSTDLSADQAATAIAQMMNVMGTSQSDVDRFGATLVALGNVGASTESEILEMAQRLAGGGKLIGLSEADVLGLSNAMASMGIEAQLGGGAMQRTFLKMYAAVKSGGSSLEGFAKIAGESASEFARQFESDPITAVEALISGLNRIDAAGQDVTAALASVGIKGTQDLNVLLRLKGANDLTADSVKLASKAWKENTALQQEAEKRYGTTESQMKMLGNQVDELAIDLGDSLLPMIKTTVHAFGDLVGIFSDLPGPVKDAGVILLGMGATITGVIGLVGTFAPKIRELDTALQSMGLGAGFASTNLKRIASIAGKGGLLVGALFVAGQALNAAFDKDYSGNITDIETDLIRLGKGAVISSLGDNIDRALSGLEDIDKHDDWGDRFLNKVIHAGGLLGEWGDKVDQGKEKVDGLDKALTHLAEVDPKMAAGALDAIKASIGDEKFQQLVPMLDDYKIALAAAGNQEEIAAEQTKKMTNAAGVSKAQIDDLDKAIDDLFNTLFGVEDAADAFQQGLNDLDDTIKTAKEHGLDMNHVLDGTTDGSLELRSALRDIARNGAEVVQQWIEQGITGEELQTKIAGLTQTIRDQFAAFGLPQEVADHYLGTLLNFPSEVVTTVSADVADAEAALARIKARLDAFGIKGNPGAYYLPNGQKGPVLPLPAGPISGSRMGNVYSFSEGGLTGAHIAKDGSILRYAEKATGGEAFVPRNGDEGRSLGILRTAADWYGASVVPKQMGAMFHGGVRPAQVAGSSASTVVQNVSVTLNVAGSVHSKDSLRKEMVDGLRYEARRLGGTTRLLG